MNTDLIQSELLDGILTVRINRPEKKNALTTAMYGALADALRRADEEPGIRVVLLTSPISSIFRRPAPTARYSVS
jgi:enoyl-CoA hydratase/carnithine racemase